MACVPAAPLPLPLKILTAARAPITLAITAAVLLRSTAMLGFQQAFWHGIPVATSPTHCESHPTP